ncbi:MAG: alpha/beta hydrolase [Alphaproteobacteria bacterium]|nr:alpha/beta hydrolase [Alphaproteobacteria bacterium]
MSQISFSHAGLMFSGYDVGQGPAIVFQHGLGGDIGQINEAFPPLPVRRLTLECRGQGASPYGCPDELSIPNFAADVVDFADRQGIGQFVVGGISMGAAIALRIAAIMPQRVKAMILARPAWGWTSAPENMTVFKIISDFVEKQDHASFEATALAQRFRQEAPDNYASLMRLFEKPNPPMVAELHRRIAASGPEISEAQVRAINVPTLVMANAIDIIHPTSLATMLAETIPSAHYVELAPKVPDKAKHVAEFHVAVTHFLKDNEIIP